MSVAETFDPTDLPDAYAMPIEEMDVSDGRLFQYQKHWDYFERLRKEDPVHLTENEEFGRFWSITKFKDIMAVDTNHPVFSNEPSIVIGDPPEDFTLPMFIAMDPPKHDLQRKIVSPTVAPANLAELEPLIRKRVQGILDSLPIGEEFNWVDKVSIELTTQMLATLFDFPFEDRHLLTYWSDTATASDQVGNNYIEEEERKRILWECYDYFVRLWNERQGQGDNPKMDFISLLANDSKTNSMLDDPLEYIGNLILLIVGGNDTTRNSISGGVHALNQFPEQYAKLRNDPSLIPNMVSEIIRWQTPLAHMRRRATQDFELGGKQIKKGDKVVMWYISGNRDETEIDRANEFLIDREKARHHIAFGFGIHRCMGNRLAEMQLKILWEEIMKRFEFVEVVGEPERLQSNFVMGFVKLPVVLHEKK